MPIGATPPASLTAPRHVPIMAYMDADREEGLRCASQGGRRKTMAAPTTEEFTLHLPEDVIEMLRRAARERRETPDAIVAEALRFSLQPVHQEALRRLKGHIRQQQAQSEPEIRAHLEAH